jgi:CheY-like chemotaxis protein
VLAGGIAHDFNNILTAIMGNASMAESKMDALAPARDHIEHIVSASHRAADLCKQMLAYSGRGKFVIKPINLSELVEQMANLLEISIAKNVVMKYQLAENLPAVEADVAQIQQVVMNLITNASEAIEDKSGVISIATGVMHADRNYLTGTFPGEEIAEGRYVYLEVSDTGCGMDAETRKKIFDPFFTTKFTGRGLGMSAVLGIVRGHKGVLKVYSEPGRGTTFKMLLPGVEEQAISLVRKEVATEAWQGAGTVLVVDDEETIREVGAIMLGEMGFAVLTAADGEEGVEMYRKHADEIVAVLLDMTMPKMGGEEAFREMRRIDPKVKVILSSGYNEQDATQRFAGKGLDGFVQKPYASQALQAKMREVMGQA